MATFLRKLNLWLTLFWVIAIIPTLLWWSESILWIALMSVWANVSGHFSAWMGGRAEQATVEASDEDSG